VGLGLLWWVLSGGDLESWLIGGPLVGWAAWRSLAIWPALPFHWGALLRFIPFFLSQSMAAAIDVASRALRPTMPLHPGLVGVPLRLPAGAARVALANAITLLPGTLSAELQPKQVVIHALDLDPELPDRVRDLEVRIGAIFGIELETLAREEVR
jgi:multicomponent Na+:H+ antiporter subunit E